MRSALTRTAVPIGFVVAALLVVSSPNTSPTLTAQSHGTWKPLFNGKDLSGWTVAAGRRGGGGTPNAAAPDAAAPPPAPSWKVEEGVLVGGQGGGRGRMAELMKKIQPPLTAAQTKKIEAINQKDGGRHNPRATSVYWHQRDARRRTGLS